MEDGGELRSDFVPVRGLDDPQALAFLVDVLQNGPPWAEPKLARPVYVHMARCLSALCLGATKDPRAFDPLVDALRSVDPNEERYTIAGYAAQGLGLLGDKRAVGPLVQSLGDERRSVRHGTLGALRLLRDIRFLEPLIRALNAEPDMNQRMALIATVASITKMTLSGDHFTDKRFWIEWWRNGDQMARKSFDEHYRIWQQYRDKKISQGTTPVSSTRTARRTKIVALGIPALPFIVEAIKEHPEDADLLVPAVSQLTDNALPETATPEQALKWWDENKANWLIPFDKTPQSETPPPL